MRGLLVGLAVLLTAGCKKEPADAVLDASVVVTSPAPNAVAPPVSTFDQAQGNPNTMPTVTTSVQTVPVGATGPVPPAQAPGRASALDKAIEASKEGRAGDVRRLLEAKVRAGHASDDEVRLVREACKAPLDRACLDDIKRKYP